MQTSEAQFGSNSLGSFDKWYSRLEDLLNLVAAAGIFVLMFIGVFQVVARTIFGTAIYGYIDWIEQSSALFAFLGAAYCQRLGGHIRMDLLLRFLSKRALWIVEALAVAIALVIVTLLIDSSFNNFMRAYRLGDSTMDIKLPVWPSKLMVPLALSVLWVRLVLQLVGYGRLVLHPYAEPRGVPVLASVEEQARTEIEEALGHAEPRLRP